jgi:hypothetical protein
MLSTISVAASVWCETVLTDVIGRPTVVIAVVTAGVHLAIRFPEMERQG